MKRLLLVGCVVVSSAIGGWAAQTLTGHAGAAVPQPDAYTALGRPVRVLDTRERGARLGAGETIRVATNVVGAHAVSVNIALTETAGAGFLTAWDCGDRPLTSVLNSTDPGENISNFVIVPVDPAGVFCVFANSPTHVVVDLMGAFSSDPVPPPTTTAPPMTTVMATTTSSTLPPGYGLTAGVNFIVPHVDFVLVYGTAANASGSTKSFVIHVRCGPDMSNTSISVFDLPTGQKRDWMVTCGGGGVSAVYVDRIEEIGPSR